MGDLSENIFSKFLYEAPDDDPPDTVSDTGPPDVPDDINSDGPPDMGDFEDNTTQDQTDTEGTNDDPPDMTDDFGDTGDFNDEGDDIQNDESQEEDLGLDDKVSAVMNDILYQNYMSLITKINTQLTNMKDNSDEDTSEIVRKLEELDENIRLYIKHKFLKEDYSKNKLFYNECLNLLGLINKVFDRSIHKGIKDQK